MVSIKWKRCQGRFLVNCMKENGSMIRGMGKGIRSTRMAIFTRASSIIINHMEKALIDGQMGRFTMASGFTDARMDSAFGRG